MILIGLKLFASMGKTTYEQIRIQSYIKEYTELINHHYDSINFSKSFSVFDDIETGPKFLQDFQFYTI